MLKFNATENQIKELMSNAFNTSKPMGMGLLHFNPTKAKPEEFNYTGGNVHMDYVQGRMVKLSINMNKYNEGFVCRSGDADIEYQSWASTYPTYQDLLKSVPGIEFEVVEEE